MTEWLAAREIGPAPGLPLDGSGGGYAFSRVHPCCGLRRLDASVTGAQPDSLTGMAPKGRHVNSRQWGNQRVASGTHMYPLIPVLTQMTGSPVFTSHVGCINSLCGHQVFTTGVAVADADPANPMTAAAMTPPRTAVLASAFTVFSLRRLTRPLCGTALTKSWSSLIDGSHDARQQLDGNRSKTIADRTHSPIELLSPDHPLHEDKPGTSLGLYA
ncbi:hypothetical protein ACWEP5_33000 [Nocardia niigatensis]